MRLTSDPAQAFADAELILVSVKTPATAEMAGLIAAHATPATVVVSLQNGVGNLDVLTTHLQPSQRVIAGMVPFNVVQTRRPASPPHFHRATSGTIQIARGEPGLRAMLDVRGLSVAEHADIRRVLWGKLLLNLNNALNALSGLPLAQQVADRRWRALLAAQIEEALAVMRAAGIRPAPIEGVPSGAIPAILRLPDAIFRMVARSTLSIDPAARSSMWDDLERRRRTEVDDLQGAILALAAKASTAAPLTVRISGLVKAAESAGAGSPRLGPEQVAGDRR